MKVVEGSDCHAKNLDGALANIASLANRKLLNSFIDESAMIGFAFQMDGMGAT